MPEHLHSNHKKESEQENVPTKPFPSVKELQAFEARQQYERALSLSSNSYITIEEYAHDPDNPTEAESKAVEALNKAFGIPSDIVSFEDYFGYPDPREPQAREPDEHRRGQHDQT